MRKSFTLLAATVPLIALAGVGLPAIAGSADVAIASAPPTAEILNLDQIPVKPVTGPRSVSGAAGDDESGEGEDNSLWLRKAHGIVHSVFPDEEHDGPNGDDDD